MLKLLQSVLNGRESKPPSEVQSEPTSPLPSSVDFPDAEVLKLEPLIKRVHGFPHFDWDAVYRWIDSLPEDKRADAWVKCERAWLAHLRDSLGVGYSLRESGDAVLLSTLPLNMAEATLEFMSKTESRILRVLDGVAQSADWGMSILVVFDDHDA